MGKECTYCDGRGEVVCDTEVRGEHTQYATPCACQVIGVPITGEGVADVLRDCFVMIKEELKAGRLEEVEKFADDGLKLLDFLDSEGILRSIAQKKLKTLKSVVV